MYKKEEKLDRGL